MLTVIRAMADAVAERRAQWLRERLDPDATAERAERAARRDAGDGAVRRRGGGPPHARAARRARRGRGRRRRRARARRDHPRDGRRARRRAGAAARDPALRRRPARPGPPRRLGATASAPTSSSPATALDGDSFVARARGARRLGARGRRRGDAQGPRPHRRPRGGEGAVRRRRRRSATRTSPTCTSRSPSQRARLGGRPLRGRRGRQRRRHARPVRGPRRASSSTAARRSTRRPRTCSPRSRPASPTRWSCCPTRRTCVMAAEEAARLAAKHGRDVIVVASDSQQGGARGAGRVRPGARPPRRTPSGSRPALGEVRVGAVAPAARDDAEGRFRRGDSVGFAGDEIVAWGGAGSTLLETVARARRRGRDRHRDRGGRGADRARRAATSELDDGDRARAPARRHPELLLADRRPVTGSGRR